LIEAAGSNGIEVDPGCSTSPAALPCDVWTNPPIENLHFEVAPIGPVTRDCVTAARFSFTAEDGCTMALFATVPALYASVIEKHWQGRRHHR